jgi:hypothetical protein
MVLGINLSIQNIYFISISDKKPKDASNPFYEDTIEKDGKNNWIL